MGARQTGQTDRVRRTTGSVFIVGMLMAALAGVAAGPTDEIRDHIQLVCLHFGDRLLRAQPGGSSEVLYVLPDGMVLTVLGESENGYLHVTWANYEGYVSGDYVTPFGT